MKKLEILKAALEQWKCPACGGSGFYTGYSHQAPEGRLCSKCEGLGLHPVASAALAEAEQEEGE